MKGIKEPDYYPSSFWLVRELLVREIKDAQRWSAVEEAASALRKIIKMGENIQREQRILDNSQLGNTAINTFHTPPAKETKIAK